MAVNFESYVVNLCVREGAPKATMESRCVANFGLRILDPVAS